MSDDKPILQRQAELQSALGPLPVVLVEKFTNWGGTQSSEVLSVQPRNLMEIQRVVVAAKEKGLQIRCLGRGHTWAPLFATDGQICMCMREVDNGEGWRIRLNEVKILSRYQKVPERFVGIQPDDVQLNLFDMF